MKRGRIGFMLIGFGAATLSGWTGVALALGTLLVMSSAVDTIRDEIRRKA